MLYVAVKAIRFSYSLALVDKTTMELNSRKKRLIQRVAHGDVLFRGQSIGKVGKAAKSQLHGSVEPAM
jgi:hypothetical protein